MMSEVFMKLQHRERSESEIKSDLLTLLISKPIQFLAEIPPDWAHCAHIDMAPDENWLEESRLRVTLASLVGHLSHTGRHPIDICAVKNPEFYSIVVRTSEPLMATG